MESPPPVTLRSGLASDALCLGVLATQVFLDTYATDGIRPTMAREVLGAYSTSAFDDALGRTDTRLWVAEVDGHLIGFVQLTLGVGHDRVPGGTPAELSRLYVQEPFTRQQVGTALLRQAETLAHEADATVIWLTAWAHNTRALAFYARHGYVDHGQTWFHFEDESHPNRLLARRLDAPARAP